MMYSVYMNGKRYCVADSKAQAENIKRALIKKQNEKQNAKNSFVNLSVEIREIRQCCDCAHYEECFFADQSTSICNSYKDAPKVIDGLTEKINVPFTVLPV